MSTTSSPRRATQKICFGCSIVLPQGLPQAERGCLVVGASSGAIDPKTFQKWVWMFIDNIQELVDVVVSISSNLLVLF
jgi:hypothetical protein